MYCRYSSFYACTFSGPQVVAHVCPAMPWHASSAGQVAACVSNGGNCWPATRSQRQSCRLPCSLRCNCCACTTVHCTRDTDTDTRHILIMTAGRGADERSVSQSVTQLTGLSAGLSASLSVCLVQQPLGTQMQWPKTGNRIWGCEHSSRLTFCWQISWRSACHINLTFLFDTLIVLSVLSAS